MACPRLRRRSIILILFTPRTILIDSCRVVFDNLPPSGRSSISPLIRAIRPEPMSPPCAALCEITVEVGSSVLRLRGAWPVPSTSRATVLPWHAGEPTVPYCTSCDLATFHRACTYNQLDRTSYSVRDVWEGQSRGHGGTTVCLPVPFAGVVACPGAGEGLPVARGPEPRAQRPF